MADPWNDGAEWSGGPTAREREAAGMVAENAEQLVRDVDPLALAGTLRQVAEEFKEWHRTGAFLQPPDRTHEAMLRLAAAWIEQHVSQDGTPELEEGSEPWTLT